MFLALSTDLLNNYGLKIYDLLNKANIPFKSYVVKVSCDSLEVYNGNVLPRRTNVLQNVSFHYTIICKIFLGTLRRYLLE